MITKARIFDSNNDMERIETAWIQSTSPARVDIDTEEAQAVLDANKNIKAWVFIYSYNESGAGNVICASHDDEGFETKSLTEDVKEILSTFGKEDGEYVFIGWALLNGDYPVLMDGDMTPYATYSWDEVEMFGFRDSGDVFNAILEEVRNF